VIHYTGKILWKCKGKSERYKDTISSIQNAYFDVIHSLGNVYAADGRFPAELLNDELRKRHFISHFIVSFINLITSYPLLLESRHLK
jgi:hypothetical protein